MLVTEESCQPWALEAFFVSVTKITNQKSTLIEKSKCMNVTIVEKNGVDGLRDEIEFRNATKIHTLLDRKSLEIATRKIKEMTMDTFTILCVATLRDEFDFGTKRCQRFIDRMNLKAECLMDDIVGWQDFIDNIDEEMGIKLRIRRND